MTGGLMGGHPLGHFINIPEQRRCNCTPAIAGISDGPNVDCPEHGAGLSELAGSRKPFATETFTAEPSPTKPLPKKEQG